VESLSHKSATWSSAATSSRP